MTTSPLNVKQFLDALVNANNADVNGTKITPKTPNPSSFVQLKGPYPKGYLSKGDIYEDGMYYNM